MGSTIMKASILPSQITATMPKASVLQRRCACGAHAVGGGECAACVAKKKTLQRRAAVLSAGGGLDPTSHNPREGGDTSDRSADAVTDRAGSGAPLEPFIAQRYRPGLGSLVDRVRVHHDSAGDALARREGAVAVTSGTDIYFATHMYEPHTTAGRNLLAHELAHVWQQHSPHGPPVGYQSQQGDRYEQEADRIAATEAFAQPFALQGPKAGIRQRRSAAEQIATEIRNAVEGLGTDEQAIFNALAGRTPAEIAAIDAAYRALSGGETLESRLRDELSGDDLSRALSLLRGETAATEAARQLWNAVRGLGTDEESIYAAVAGRTAEQWQAIQDAYRQLADESLISRLQDELTSSEWAHLQTLLPGAAGGAVTPEDRATVAANQIQAAVAGPGTDEEAIYSALTGRTEAELQDIARRYKLLAGEELDARLRDELTDSEYARTQLLLHPLNTPERVARALRDAVEGPGTNESAIMAILTGRPAAELPLIRAAYQRLYGESLVDRLRDELSGADLAQALQLEQTGLLEPADEIYIAISGLGTDEERLFAVLREISISQATIEATIDRYAAKGYGDMLADIRDDLSGGDFDRAMELLHGLTPTASCSPDQRREGLNSISIATSMAGNSVARLDADIAANRLSSGVSKALANNFNPGGAAGAITVALAGQIRPILNQARDELLTKGQVTCISPAPLPCGADPCVANPDCSRFTVAWTCPAAGAIVRLCPAFFDCSSDRPTDVLHEFVHHTGVLDQHYIWDSAFATLTPRGDGSSTDSLNNADSFAYFAKGLF
jgi:hypothetical protein